MKRIDVIRSEINRCFTSQVRNYNWTIIPDSGNFVKIFVEVKEQIGEPYAIEQIDLSKVIDFKRRIEKKDFRMLPWRVISRNDKLCLVLSLRSNNAVDYD